MKKKIFSGIGAFAIAAAIITNVNISTIKSGLSELSLANIEALADSEYFDAWNNCAMMGCNIQLNYDCHVYMNIGGTYHYSHTCQHFWSI